ncbi:8270_t:CDS:2, partial [Gigaspora rosea]
MILKKLFQKYRKTEPTSIFIFRQFVLALLLVSLIGYTWLIIWDIYSDNPVVQNSLIEENSFAVPEFLFITPKASISCNFINSYGIHDCAKYVIQPQFVHTDERNTSTYKGSFFTNELLFSKIPNNGLNSLEFTIYINDSNFNASDYISLPYVVFQMKNTGTASDISYVDYTDSLQSPKDSLGLYSRFSRAISALNLYSIASYSSYKFKLTRKRKDVMLPSWENYIGFSSKLVKTSYFSSSMETFPFQNDTPSSLLKITIEQPTYTVQVETDK